MFYGDIILVYWSLLNDIWLPTSRLYNFCQCCHYTNFVS